MQFDDTIEQVVSLVCGRVIVLELCFIRCQLTFRKSGGCSEGMFEGGGQCLTYSMSHITRNFFRSHYFPRKPLSIIDYPLPYPTHKTRKPTQAISLSLVLDIIFIAFFPFPQPLYVFGNRVSRVRQSPQQCIHSARPMRCPTDALTIRMELYIKGSS